MFGKNKAIYMVPGQGAEGAALEYWQGRLQAITVSARQRDLALQLGDRQPLENDEFQLTMEDLKTIRRLDRGKGKKQLYHLAADHFLRSRVEPFQAMLTTWLNGANARVDGRNVPFNQVVTWCQQAHDTDTRSTLTREVRSLCRFLAPFSHATWKALLDVLSEELLYPNYITFCEEKRGLSLGCAAAEALAFLDATRESYEKMLQPLLYRVTSLSLEQASRFDAIYLLGLRYLDRFFPAGLSNNDLLEFFYKIGHRHVLHSGRLIIHQKDDPGVQPYCIPVHIPDEIHIIVGPMQGWLDLESLCHELGHAMCFLSADGGMSGTKIDFFQSGGLSESFAFLLQKMCLSTGFLHGVLGLDHDVAAMISRVHDIKWLTLARRYAAKLVIEVENFQQGFLQRGEQYYADTMQRQTGFHYDPETYLFDLMPDFYSLDYFQAFLGSSAMEKFLQNLYGNSWYLDPAAGFMLQEWWRGAGSLDLADFIRDTTGHCLQADSFVESIPSQHGWAADNYSF